jgi:signal transduction histidine kinase
MKLEGLMKRIAVRYIEQPLQTKVTVLIIDKEHSLAVELKDDKKENARDAIGLATYSNSKATVSSYVSIFESLWNQAELYNHISTLYEQLRGHDKMQREFINIAAHELRTPIQPILGLAEVLRDRISVPEQSRLLDAIIRNARRLLQLQEALLDITRIEANMLKLNLEVFDLNSAVAEFLKDYRNQPYGYAGDGGKSVELVFQPESNTAIFVSADKIRLNQVLSNLLSNASKFTTVGSVRVETAARKRDDGGIANVSVCDTGTGIDPEILPRLFAKFATKSEKGTGLGLFISKSIIEAHGGKMWAENNRGQKGARFSFLLPLAAPDESRGSRKRKGPSRIARNRA